MLAGAAIGPLASFDRAQYRRVLAAGCAVGLTPAPLQPMRFALLMDLVGARHVSSANAVNASRMLRSRVVAPAIAAAPIAGVGVAPSFRAAWHLPASWALLRMREVPRVAIAAARGHCVRISLRARQPETARRAGGHRRGERVRLAGRAGLPAGARG